MRFASWWDPFAEIEALQRAVNRLFENFAGRSEVTYPPVNVCDTGESYVVRAWMPGVKREDINLSVMADTLTIQGEKREPQVKDGNFYRRERSFGRFHKVVELPTEVNAEGVKARYQDGILTVTLPKAESAKPRQITVETE
ncbi:TPA: Hsp20/alpha crystallin family protein [Candidatus Poribacteria bacterium]|nr:Hsp20/alpha crystallin family protein [Candidatus Poribacteria bacterium]